MNLSFRENFQWVSLVSVLGIYGYYFARVIPPAGPDVTAEQLALFGSLLLLLIVIHIVGAIVLISLSRFKDPATDERDRLISLKAYRSSSYILAVGAILGITCALFIEGNFWVTHSLLACMVLSQLVESATRIFHYRRGF